VPDRLTILSHQNVPESIASRLKLLRPTKTAFRTGDVGLSGKADEQVFAWAQQQSAGSAFRTVSPRPAPDPN
jgi:hypothetical protein